MKLLFIRLKILKIIMNKEYQMQVHIKEEIFYKILKKCNPLIAKHPTRKRRKQCFVGRTMNQKTVPKSNKTVQIVMSINNSVKWGHEKRHESSKTPLVTKQHTLNKAELFINGWGTPEKGGVTDTQVDTLTERGGARYHNKNIAQRENTEGKGKARCDRTPLREQLLQCIK